MASGLSAMLFRFSASSVLWQQNEDVLCVSYWSQGLNFCKRKTCGATGYPSRTNRHYAFLYEASRSRFHTSTKFSFVDILVIRIQSSAILRFVTRSARVGSSDFDFFLAALVNRVWFHRRTSGLLSRQSISISSHIFAPLSIRIRCVVFLETPHYFSFCSKQLRLDLL